MADTVDVALSVDALGPRLTGIGRYCLELVRGLPRASGVGRLSWFRGPHWLDDPEAALAEDWRPVRRGRLDRFMDRWRRRPGDAVVHGPNFFLPDWAERGVITVHDLSVLLYPETHPVERIRDFERRFQRSLDRTTAVITDSAAVRTEVVSMLGVAPERVYAVPLGVHAVPAGIDPMLVRTSGLTPGGYSLCVSTFEPRKRIDRLIAAYGRLPLALRQAVPLVLVGAAGWRNETLNAAIDVAQAEGWARRLDFVPQSLLDALYAGARLFIYPSGYEGFGLPPIEAMQHGVPTLIGAAACLVEVTRGAARVVDADDVPTFTTALSDALQDDVWRAAATLAGRQVAASYRWPDCITATVEVYRQAAGR